MKIVDPHEEQLHLAVPVALRQPASQIVKDLLSPVMRLIPRRGTILQGADASELLEELHKKTVDSAISTVRSYSYIQWLWLLRRTPVSVWRGSLATTAPADTLLSQALAACAEGAPAGMAKNSGAILSFDVTEREVHALRELVIITRVVASIAVARRTAAKNIKIEFAESEYGSVLPFGQRTTAQATAIDSYDQRSARASSVDQLFVGMGSYFNVSSPPSSRKDFLVGCGLTSATPDFVEIPSTFVWPNADNSNHATGRTVKVRMRAMPTSINIGELREFLVAHPQALECGSGRTALLLLRLAGIMFGEAGRGSPLNLGRRGYVCSQLEHVLGASALMEPLKQTAKFVGGSPQIPDFLELLIAGTKVSPDFYPFKPGPFVALDGEHFIVDLAAATYSLRHDFAATRRTGAIANARAQHWEIAVRTAVSKTFATPDPELRALIGTTLRLNRQKLTDLDAAMVVDGTTVLISCKSMVFRSEHLEGEHAHVRNAASTLLGYHRDWAARLNKLRDNPIGDNYNLAGRHLVGITCTPHVVYTAEPELLGDALPGLPVACSLEELETWLRGRTT